MAGYNQEGQELDSSHQMTSTRRKQTERAPWNLTNLTWEGGGGGGDWEGATNSRLQNLAENS